MVNHSESIQNLVAKDTSHVQLSTAQLVEKSLKRGEGRLTETGALRAETGKYTGRSPKDRFIVEDDTSRDKVDWGEVNQPISEDVFRELYRDFPDVFRLTPTLLPDMLKFLTTKENQLIITDFLNTVAHYSTHTFAVLYEIKLKLRVLVQRICEFRLMTLHYIEAIFVRKPCYFRKNLCHMTNIRIF